jgi:hypothetical protein
MGAPRTLIFLRNPAVVFRHAPERGRFAAVSGARRRGPVFEGRRTLAGAPGYPGEELHIDINIDIGFHVH